MRVSRNIIETGTGPNEWSPGAACVTWDPCVSEGECGAKSSIVEA